ncbi:MAG: sulfite exporter TauE/SafE family protein [Pseudomonadota bacterium]
MLQQISSLVALDGVFLALGLLAVFAGAFLKGYTGFGASMFWVTSLSLLLPPLEVVPMVLMFEVITSLVLLPQVWQDVRWKSILTLMAGTAVFTPLGIYGLASLPADPIRIGLAAAVFILAILMLQGYSFKKEPGQGATFGIGAVAGVLNGSMGIAGPPVVLFYFSSPIGVTAGRASIVAFFFGTDLMGTAMFASQGFIGETVLWRTALFVPVIVVGALLGHRGFVLTDVATFKKIALFVLMVLAAALILRVFW